MYVRACLNVLFIYLTWPSWQRQWLTGSIYRAQNRSLLACVLDAWPVNFLLTITYGIQTLPTRYPVLIYITLEFHVSHMLFVVVCTSFLFFIGYRKLDTGSSTPEVRLIQCTQTYGLFSYFEWKNLLQAERFRVKLWISVC